MQSESHKSDSEDIDGVEIDEEIDEQPIIIDNEGPPCKMPRKEKGPCGGSSTDVDLEGTQWYCFINVLCIELNLFYESLRFNLNL